MHTAYLLFIEHLQVYIINSWSKVLVPYMDSALSMGTSNTFKSNKLYRHMAPHVREEKQLKR